MTDTPVATNPYPITLTREALVAEGACPEGLEAFDAVCPTGVLTIPNAHAHSALLGTALGAHEDWAIFSVGLLPPVCVQGPDRASVVAGACGQATAGDYGHATVGYEGHATVGAWGHATACAYGRATAGPYGHATAGYRGHAIAGYKGHATAGYRGTATAGDGGTLRLAYVGNDRDRWAVAYVGEDGIEPNVAYKVDDNGVFYKA